MDFKPVRLERPMHTSRGREFAFKRTDGLYVVVYASTHCQAVEEARKAYAANDAAPAWLRRQDGSAITLGSEFEGGIVVAINEDNRTLKLHDGRMVMFQEEKA